MEDIGEIDPSVGEFAGHFPGENDAWREHFTMTLRSRNSVFELFKARFSIEAFSELEWDGSAFGLQKHWHSFEVIARKYSR